MAILVGSARHDENGKLKGGKAGDQLQKTSAGDMAGEVSMQNMYTHSRGWYILRPKSVAHADKIAERMITACNNANIGYDQNQRTGILSKGIDTKVKTETDCSTLVRQCVKEATGKDPGNFTTLNEASALEASGLFEKRIAYVNQTKTPVFNGDVLVTKTKGHTVVVVSGNGRTTANWDLVFNATFYANKYPDLKAVFGTDKNKLLEHFKAFGVNEGRQAIATFNIVAYKNKNADLVKAYGNAPYMTYLEHYFAYGKREGRTCI